MNEPATAEDRDDMRRLAEGDPSALDALMFRHGGRLHAYLRRLLQNASDAEDLAQECFVRVYEHRTRFDPRQSFLRWLYTIATNLVRDRYRWRSRHPETTLECDSDGNPSGFAEDTAASSAQLRGPAESLAQAEAAEAVRSAIATLPPEIREPLLLAEFEDLAHAEIAAILDLTPKAVEVRIYRARQRLRLLLRPWLEEPVPTTSNRVV